MSIDATRWAWKQRGITATQKLVLLALADRADELHECFPSARRLHHDTELDRKTILTAISDLIEAGHVIDTGRKVGHGSRVLRLVGVESRELTDTNIGTGTKSGTGSRKRGATGTESGTATDTNIGTATGTNIGILNLSENLSENRESGGDDAPPALSQFGRFAPADWNPDPAIERTGARPAPGVDRDFELQQFRLHEHIGGKSDWDRAWCKWLNQAKPRVAPATPANPATRARIQDGDDYKRHKERAERILDGRIGGPPPLDDGSVGYRYAFDDIVAIGERVYRNAIADGKSERTARQWAYSRMSGETLRRFESFEGATA